LSWRWAILVKLHLLPKISRAISVIITTMPLTLR